MSIGFGSIGENVRFCQVFISNYPHAFLGPLKSPITPGPFLYHVAATIRRFVPIMVFRPFERRSAGFVQTLLFVIFLGCPKSPISSFFRAKKSNYTFLGPRICLFF